MAVDEYRVTLEDVAQFAKEVEQTYECVVVLELRPGWSGKLYHWRVEAKAYVVPWQPAMAPVVVRGRDYPSRRRQTFPGAALDALMELDAALSASKHLAMMGGWDPAAP